MAVAAPVVGALLYALAFPPFDWAPAAWLTLVPLLLAVRSGDARRAFRMGALYGLASGWLVTWWLTQAVSRYFGTGIVLSGLAMSAAYAVAVASAFGVFAAGASLLCRHERPAVALPATAALWAATELLRGRLLGQPWALLGYSQHAQLALIQVAAVTGVYGVSFLVALGNAAIAETIVRARRRAGLLALVRPLAANGAVVALVAISGAIHATHGPTGGYAARTVALVQTNVEPAFAWTRAYAERQLAAHVAATEALPADRRIGLVVWPENAVPRYLESDPGLAAALAGVASRRHADLLFGAPRYEAGRTYNAVRLITAAGRDGGHYDKRHLVLFAEAGPLAGPVPAGPAESPREFAAGDGASILRSFVPLGVSICHEILYPELVHRAVRDGAALLVNVSNDGWLDGGHGIASRQHFAMAVFRAVESRRYLVRATTTGISGVIDPYGRVVAMLPPNRPGVVTASVAGRTPITPYSRLGDGFAVGCALVASALCWRHRPAVAWRRRRLVPAPTAL
jgi:apolipoprotein N-acyltransferase